MSLRKCRAQLARGEDDRHMHLEAVSTAPSMAANMAAFANAEGGTIYVGVAPDGGVPGMPRAALGRVYKLIRFAALQHGTARFRWRCATSGCPARRPPPRKRHGPHRHWKASGAIRASISSASTSI